MLPTHPDTKYLFLNYFVFGMSVDCQAPSAKGIAVERDRPLKVDKTPRCDPASPFASHGNLVTSVIALVDRARQGPQNGDLTDAADRALTSAVRAERRLADLWDRVARLERLARTDDLTGLLNRRGFEAEVRHAVAIARRYRESGLLVYIDLDGFKLINDSYGHAAGDEVLRQVGRVLAANIRNTDFVGRLGGDEFAVLLTRASRHHGWRRAKALDAMLNSMIVDWCGRCIAVRASLGVRPFGADDTADAVLIDADRAMYTQKADRAADAAPAGP